MAFPWRRYWLRVGLIFVVALVLSLAAAVGLNGGRLNLEALLVALVDSAVLAVVVAFPLTQRIYRGPRR